METATPAALLRLEESDRTRLGEALRMLVERGSILGSESAYADLYSWSFANRPWLEELAALLELQLFWEHESRLVQAIPRSRSFLLRLRMDATLVLMTLWYEFDTAVRDRGETPPVSLTAEQLNDSLDAKFRALRKAIPGHTRLLEILRLAQRRNLLRFTAAADPAQTRIDILATIKRVIPFQNVEDWTRYAQRFTARANGAADVDPTNNEIPDETDAED